MKVWHMNGAGNDFMVLDGCGMSPDYSAMARRLCAMTHADGFMAVDDSRTADFKLHFYNSDGTRGEMCGNGSRCVCRFAYSLGLAGEQMTVETDAGIVRGWRLSESLYRVQLNDPGVLDLRRTPDAAYVELGDPGVPHAVAEQPGLAFAQREALRPRAFALRHDPAFPKGANANLFSLLGDGEARVLTFERGVEDYTQACGTGCASVAAALWAQGRLPGNTLLAHTMGGDLRVTVEGSTHITALYLEGPTEVTKIYDLP